MNLTRTSCFTVLAVTVTMGVVAGADWMRFRGPNGSGISEDQSVPVTWSESEHLKWKITLPGPGSSSPIVIGHRVLVTCYSGYAVEENDFGELDKLTRHLVCVDRNSGKLQWAQSVKAVLPEDSFGGMGITEHGYASSTPVTDGERVYVFFGKTGVLAFDLDGNQLWQVSVGQESGAKHWGSASSLILHQDLLIVNAAEESQSVRALNKLTGEEVWKAEAAGLESTYGTPALIDRNGGTQELLLAVPYELWALDPKTGKMRWYAETGLTQNAAPSVLTKDNIVYAFGGYPRQGSVAIRAGEKGDATQSHVLWTAQTGPYVPSPVLHNGRLYWVNRRGVVICMDAATGDVVYENRLNSAAGSPKYYSSPVLANGKIYAVSRNVGTFVLAAKPEFQQVAQNQIPSDDSDFNATPAISNGQIFLRSNRALYCIAAD